MEKVVHKFELLGLVCITAIIALTGCSEVGFEEIPVASLSEPDGNNNPPPLGPVTFATESFTQGATAKPVDILFVVDNSPSMQEEQQKMGERIQSFLSKLNNVDWKIGITTTDVSDGDYGLKGDLLNIENGSGKHLSKKNL